MKYPLFLSDFDGTLVRADGTISQVNKRAIAAYRAGGGVFAVCTGRGPAAIVPRLKELGLTQGLAVAYQGATVMDIATGELLKDDGFAQEDALKVIRLLEEGGRHVHVYTVDKLYCNVDDELLHMYERICRVTAERITGMPLSEYVKEHRLRVVKVLAMVEKEDRIPLMRWLAPQLGDAFYVTCSADFLVEVMPAGQSKAAAVDFLCGYYGIARAKCAAIGDQLNDLPMIERAGGKFAVANAEEELKKRARVVASVEEDGVAQALAIAMGEEV